MTTAAAATPAEVVDGFLRVLESAKPRALTPYLCREVCFLTQDSTAISGRQRVAALLVQLGEGGLRIRSHFSHTLPLADFALVSARWEMRMPGESGPLAQTTDATLSLAHRETSWKLLLIAPWGWP